MGNPVNTHWCSLFKKGPRVEGSSLTNWKKASVVWLFRQVQIGILASQTVSLTPPPVESSFRKVCHLHLTFRRCTLLLWERQMRGKKTSGVWFLMTLLSFQKAPASVHHGLPSLPLEKSYFLHCRPRRHHRRRHRCTRQVRQSRSHWPGIPFGLRPLRRWRTLKTLPSAQESGAEALPSPARLWWWSCERHRHGVVWSSGQPSRVTPARETEL